MYEVGDKVRIIGNDPLVDYVGICFIEDGMRELVGECATIKRSKLLYNDDHAYQLCEDEGCWWWHESWLEPEEPEKINIEGIGDLKSLFEI